MRVLSLLALMLSTGLAVAGEAKLAAAFGNAETIAGDFALTGEFYALLQANDGGERLSANLAESTATQFAVTFKPGEHVLDFRLLPQRRLAYVLRHGEAGKEEQTLYVVHLSSRKSREVLTAPTIRFPALVPADQFGFQVLLDHPGKRARTTLLSVNYDKGHGDTVYKFPGRCELHSNADGLLVAADCVDAAQVHQYLLAPAKGKTWTPLSVPKTVQGAQMVGLFLNGDYLFEQRTKSGGTQLLRFDGKDTQEIAASQSRAPARYLRSFDRRVIIGAIWLEGEPSAEFLDIAHPDVSRYIDWTFKNSNTVIEVLGRSYDQRLTMVTVTRPDRPKSFQIWHRDEIVPREIGAAYRDAVVPSGLNREARQLALRNGKLRDGFVTHALQAPGRLAVVMTGPAPSWGFAPFALSLANQDFDVLEVGTRAELSPAEQAADLIDALKWARNVELGDERPACLFADPALLKLAAAKLYALSTDCLVGIPDGRLPQFAEQAEPLLKAAVDGTAAAVEQGTTAP